MCVVVHACGGGVAVAARVEAPLSTLTDTHGACAAVSADEVKALYHQFRSIKADEEEKSATADLINRECVVCPCTPVGPVAGAHAALARRAVRWRPV